MKKLMIAACAVAFAAVAQASSMAWGIEYSYDFNGNGNTEMGGRGTATPYAVYLFDNSVLSRDNAILAAAEAGWADVYASKFVNGGTTTITGDAYSMGATAVDDIDQSKLTLYTKGSEDQYASAYLAIFNAGKMEDATHVYFTEVSEEGISPLFNGAFHFQDGGNDLTNMNGQAGWTELAAVPEPTSGLLLLLGVAGLALRRRRA